MPELVVILVIALLVFGAGKLPEVGSSLGKAMHNFKRAADAEAPPAQESLPPAAKNIDQNPANPNPGGGVASEKGSSNGNPV